MKKLFFIVLMSIFYLQNNVNASETFKCDGRIFCSQMTSCEEVLFFSKNCPNVKLNGNNNSFSCEKKWCKDRISSTDSKPEQPYSKGVTLPDSVVQKSDSHGFPRHQIDEYMKKKGIHEGPNGYVPDWAKNSAPQTSSSSFKCDGRTRCTQMTSCEEAKFFLKNCPNVKMDGDGDGIPCEEQWCKR